MRDIRDIKFRAWNKNTKKMYKIGQITFEKGIWNYQPDDREYIGMSIPYQPSFILMQYTGLKDKNGKEIYEGDIVKIKHEYDNTEYICEIIYLDGAFRTKKFIFGSYYDCLYYWYADDCEIEVVGNIYDNPELLGGNNGD